MLIRMECSELERAFEALRKIKEKAGGSFDDSYFKDLSVSDTIAADKLADFCKWYLEEYYAKKQF